MTIPAHTHQAIISADAPPRPACHSSGPSTARAADVTCPACLNIAAAHKARTEAEVHDTHAIPADDVPATAAAVTLPALSDEATAELEAELDRYGTNIADMVWRSETGNIALGTSCESCGGTPDLYLTPTQAITFAAHIALVADAAPAKTHDLSVFRNQGKLVIAVEDETDDLRVYLPEGVDKDLGRALALMTPAQIALLIGELTGDER